MNSEIDAAFGQLHEPILALIMVLVDLDPAIDSPEWKILDGLADAVHAYESVKFPIDEAGVESGAVD